MTDFSTNYSIQELKNLSADKSVNPPIVREGLMGKASDGAYYNVGVNTDGSLMDGLNIGSFDYVSMALSGADTTETYTFKTGGVSGTTVATVTVVYTTSTRNILSSVTKV